ncbi:MAG: hypothetical protein R3B41_04320 [Candidatus Doudnabacteria bacterium]
MDKRNFDYRISDHESILEKQAPIEINAQEIEVFSSIRQNLPTESKQKPVWRYKKILRAEEINIVKLSRPRMTGVIQKLG